jgi:ActR/RegA family two-component response regulator
VERLDEGVAEADNISAQREKVVVLDGLWPIRLAVSALVRGATTWYPASANALN